MRTETLASHILPVSGTMIGVCVTLIGLVKLAEARHGTSHVDEYAALAAITFLASALASYLSMRYSDREKLSIRQHFPLGLDRDHPGCDPVRV